MEIILVMNRNAIRKQLDRIEDLIIIYHKHGIRNRIQALCERAEKLQGDLDRMEK